MPPPFQELCRDDFVKLLQRFPFERVVDQVHVHHTWRPRASEYRGHETLLLMWQTDRWRVGRSDLAQHVSVAPGGQIWTGRDWNRAPRSAPGHDGDERRGPFMVMLIGDFNEDGETLSEAQRSAAIDVIARVQVRFALAPSALAFHRELSPEIQCPGTTFDRTRFVGDVASAHAALVAAAAAPTTTPPGDRYRPFGEDAEAWYQFIILCNAQRDRFAAEREDGNGAEEDGR